MEATDAGWAPDRRAFLERYPELRAELEEFFAGQDRLLTLATSLEEQPPTAASLTTAPGSQNGEESIVLPQSFGDYDVLEEIARGGMGIVYRVRQKSLNRI